MYMDELVDFYCANEMRKLKNMCDPMITKIGGVYQKDYDDYYSIALEVLFDSVKRYDEENECSFDCFLASNIKRKFNTEIRDRNRDRRVINSNTISIDTPINDESEGVAYNIPDETTVESLLFSEGSERYSEKMLEYLNCLSSTQQKVLHLISIGFSKAEILEELHISSKEYNDCYEAIHSYRNTSILM